LIHALAVGHAADLLIVQALAREASGRFPAQGEPAPASW
jgi:hypothetical protein